MKIKEIKPPREYMTGAKNQITIFDCARIELSENEQVTFTAASARASDLEYDVARKNWGFYATPSLNGRLSSFNLRGVLVKNSYGKFYVMLVEGGKESSFYEYLEEESIKIISWLDTDESLLTLEEKLVTNDSTKR